MDSILTGKIIWFAGLVIWLAIRYKPNRQARKTNKSYSGKSPIEYFSMAVSFTGLGILPLVWVFTGHFKQFDHPTHWLWVAMGTIGFASALILFRKTHKALGAMWSVSLELRENHKLITEGIYNKVRHPMYSAFWLWAVSQPLLLANWVAGFSGIVGFGTLYLLRVGQEEQMMEQEFGQDYRDYCARTKRIIPHIH